VCEPGGECRDIYQLLLLHKPRKNDAWQLPQGGVEEGETVEQAALRELMEEAGISDCTIIGKSEHCYQYDFPESFRRFRRDDVCGQCIHYLYGLAPTDVAVQVDNKEIDGHIWVDLQQIGHYVKRPAYKELVENLYAEAMKALDSVPNPNP
jgi:putative (di)nucleoside polyphosphate hydrolase